MGISSGSLDDEVLCYCKNHVNDLTTDGKDDMDIKLFNGFVASNGNIRTKDAAQQIFTIVRNFLQGEKDWSFQ